MLKKTLIAKTDAEADKSQIYSGKGWRATYITPRLIRFEAGTFTDLPSVAVWFRRFESGNMKKPPHIAVWRLSLFCFRIIIQELPLHPEELFLQWLRAVRRRQLRCKKPCRPSRTC